LHQRYVSWETALGGQGRWIWNQVVNDEAPNPAIFTLEAGLLTFVFK
jgi:hypothetical protein